MTHHFGPFTLLPAAAELRRGSERVELRPKCFDLLVYLAEHPGRLITKDELLGKVWNDVVVTEATLSRTITELRAALGDHAEHPQYIETVSRRGYKFVATPAIAQAQATPFTLVHRSREYPLGEGDHLIGRGPDVAITLYSSAASRHHARLTIRGETATLEDLGSRNGTFVNQNRVTGSVALQPGDEITIGADRFVLWAPASETGSLHPSRA